MVKYFTTFFILIILLAATSCKPSKPAEEKANNDTKTGTTAANEEGLVAQEEAPRSKETYKRLSSCEQYIGLPFMDLERQKGKGKIKKIMFEEKEVIASVLYTENWFGMDRLSEYVIHPDEQVVKEVIVHCDGYSRKDAIAKVAKILGATGSTGKGEKGSNINYYAHWQKNALWYRVQDSGGKIQLVMSKSDYKVRNQF